MNNKARLVAGYCWDWKSKKQKDAMDVAIPEHSFAMQWNLTDDGSLWILQPNSIKQVGCIHTCQGLELNYVGVIIGNDLIVRDGNVLVESFCTFFHGPFHTWI
ncbi:MAG: DNA/RNA helicase domain-containing protein [Candidatus Marinimicrobia bacterium]|nr:DNA/RNA helicase domain-containing protein [Candidatus Neomarinimicrobiota bacterium]